ncbi:MAG: zf-TFIIB domain-containing protein [Planctomycetota bacterium]
MRCPVCTIDMFVLEFERVELDYCHRCGGVWLDSGELELVGDRAGVLGERLLSALESGRGARPAEAKRPCPVCGKSMRELKVDTEPPIAVDRCPREHGLWFDRGELASVVNAAGAAEDNLLARFFADLSEGGAEAAETET